MSRLSLRKETLAELTATELGAVHGAGTIDTYLTYMCFLIINAAVQGVKNGTHQMTLVECAAP